MTVWVVKSSIVLVRQIDNIEYRVKLEVMTTVLNYLTSGNNTTAESVIFRPFEYHHCTDETRKVKLF